MTTQNKTLRFVFFAVIFFVIILTIFSYTKINSLIKSAALVNYTTHVSLGLEKIIGNLKDAETGQRGYLLTHNKKFLEPYTNSLKEYPQNIKVIKQLIIDNPEQQKNILAVELLAQHRVDYLQKILAVAELRTPTPEELLYGKAIMDSLRTEIDNMIARENILIEDRNKNFDRQSMFAPAMLLILSLIALAIIFIAYWRLNKANKNEESKKQLQNILQNAPAAIAAFEGPEHRFIMANEAYQKQNNRKEKDFLGKNFREVFPELEGTGSFELFDSVYATSETFTASEYAAMIDSDNNGIPKQHYFNFSLEALKNESKEIYGLMVMAFDITKQVESKKIIKESEAFNRSVLESSPDCVKVLDAEGRLQFMNVNGLCTMEIDDFSAFKNKPWTELWGEENKHLINEAIDKALAGNTASFQAFCPTAKGTPKWWDVLVSPVVSSGSNKINSLISVSRDVTEQMLAQKKIEESEKQFNTLANNIQNLAWIANDVGYIYWYNQRWYDYTGTTLEEMEGQGWEKVHHHDHVNRVVDFVKKAWHINEPFELTFPLRGVNGEYRWFLTRAYPVCDEAGKISNWIGTNTDIHEQKMQEEKKDEFISIASHEMKTPLTTAKAYLQMLELSLDENDEDSNLFAKKASQSVNRLNELVGELLDASKIRLGKLNYTITTFNFNDMIESTVENIQLTSQTHTIIKTGKVSDEVTGDKDRLQQVVINLLNNAIKYSPGAETVFITVEQEKDVIKVTVKDTGIGMSNHSLNKIFEKYHRIEEHAVHFQGLGIGLFISYEIIQRHHGKLWAESEPGKGSTFYFTIPLDITSPQ
jgi:PAS domain S-box-containing protein